MSPCLPSTGQMLSVGRRDIQERHLQGEEGEGGRVAGGLLTNTSIGDSFARRRVPLSGSSRRRGRTRPGSGCPHSSGHRGAANTKGDAPLTLRRKKPSPANRAGVQFGTNADAAERVRAIRNFGGTRRKQVRKARAVQRQCAPSEPGNGTGNLCTSFPADSFFAG